MNGQPNGTAPILCAHLLRTVDEKLVDLLGSLAPSEWDLQTVAPLGRSAMSLLTCSTPCFANFPWFVTSVMWKPLRSVRLKMSLR